MLNRSTRRAHTRLARRAAGVGGVVAIAAGGLAVTTTLASRLTPERVFKHRLVADRRSGPIALALGTFLPYGALSLFGLRTSLIATAREINLLYQYWIHTDSIRNLDRNHGSILIIWDRLFGTFEPESAEVVYGLTKNIDTFDPARIAAHEHADMVRDVAGSMSWRERLSYVVRGPGWAYQRSAEQYQARRLATAI